MSDTQDMPTFVLRAPQHFWWEVKIPAPVDGDYAFAKLDLLFTALPQPELDKMQGLGLADGEKVPTNDEICRRVVRGWRHLPDENGEPVIFSPEALVQLLAFPMARECIAGTFLAASKGLAARKNA